MIDYNSELRSERNLLIGIFISVLLFFGIVFYTHAEEYYLYPEDTLIYDVSTSTIKFGGINDLLMPVFDEAYASTSKLSWLVGTQLCSGQGKRFPTHTEASYLYNQLGTTTWSSRYNYGSANAFWVKDPYLLLNGYKTASYLNSLTTGYLNMGSNASTTLYNTLCVADTSFDILDLAELASSSDYVNISDNNNIMGTTTEAFTQLKGINLGLGIICTILFIFVATYTFNHFSAKGKYKWPY